MKANKGGQYERAVCKQLSLWWTHGERDDVFWRSSQSGGRATTRAKRGLRTHGSYGDIAAVDPIGEPLIKFATIELKRGHTHGSAGDLLDVRATRKQRPFEAAINQAISSAQQAGSIGWMLIVRRDQRVAMLYMPSFLYRLVSFESRARYVPRCAFRMFINQPESRKPKRVDFVGLHLEDFLQKTKPIEIINCVTEHETNKTI